VGHSRDKPNRPIPKPGEVKLLTIMRNERNSPACQQHAAQAKPGNPTSKATIPGSPTRQPIRNT